MSRIDGRWWFVLVSPLLFGFDWCTKEAARALPLGGEVPVVPGLLAFFHAENPYVAFSMPVPYALVVTFGFAALGVLGFMVSSLPREARVQAAALGAIAAGALGNLIDRLVDGSVTDFVKVYTDSPSLAPRLIELFGTATWPIFNVADAAVLGGGAAWVLHGLLQRDVPEVPVIDEGT